jgi:hypothetical protein
LTLDILGARLCNQGLSAARFAKPQEVVGWLGAVQAQDYPGAKWALALRMRRATDAAIERASPRSVRTAGSRSTAAIRSSLRLSSADASPVDGGARTVRGRRWS